MRSARAERLAVGVLFALGAGGAFHALETAIAHSLAAGATESLLRTPSQARTQAALALLAFAGGLGLLLLGRALSARRGRDNLSAGSILPAVVAAAGIGLTSQMGYGDPLRHALWPGPGFALGLALGSLAAALVLFLRPDPVALLRRHRVPLAALVVLGCLGMRLFGSGPAGSDTYINLNLGALSVQPLEAIKLVFVCLVALVLGENAIQLRFQRERAWLLRFPRPRLLALATFFLVTLFAGLVLLAHDLGPTLVLSLVFLALFYIVTRSAEWVVVALGVVGLGVLAIARDPWITGSRMLVTRFEMWLNPWFNGLPHGSQLAESLWAIAAGGFWGQGAGAAHVGGLSAGHTDLMMAHLAEETGVLGGAAYLLAIGLVVYQGLKIAAGNREPERMLIGAACALLLLAQWAVIFGGTTGLLPLTGLAAPFLSWGKSSAVVYFVAVGVLLRLAEDGGARAPTAELTELRVSIGRVAAGAGVALAGAAATLFYLGVVHGPQASARGAVVTLRDGTIRLRHDPRLGEITRRIGRGEILDRNGMVLAGTDASGARVYPLGRALGTLLGPPRPDLIHRREWSQERIHEEQLRGFPETAVRPGVWKARGKDGRERFLFAVQHGREEPEDRRRAARLADGDSTRFVPFPAPDLTEMVAVQRAGERALVAARNASGRSVRLTLDARLQARASTILAAHVGAGPAGAAVVLDVDTGQVLARAQWPDVDLGDPGWAAALRGGDARFRGIYGPWADKTGAMGFYQAGSVAKLYTALAYARSGPRVQGRGCGLRTEEAFPCLRRDAQGPAYRAEGWRRAVHDHHKSRPHGDVDLVEGLAKSCNVYFAQLGLKLGPGPLRSVTEDGVEFGWDPDFDPGEPGSRKLASTAFGQGAAAMNVSQAARLVATIGSGGVYRRCPPSLLLDADCEETRIADESAGIAAILAGMREAMLTGTGAGLAKVPGVRVYGKTGTADAIVGQDEAPYGLEPGAVGAPPHAWFLALAEAEAGDGCDPGGSGRLAVAVVLPRAGSGTLAGAVAVEIIAAARELGYLGVL